MLSEGVKRFFKNNNRSIKDGRSSETGWYSRLIREFIDPMSEAIESYRDYYKVRPGRVAIGILKTRDVKAQMLAYISLKVLFDFIVKKPNLLSVTSEIGKRVEDEMRFHSLHEEAPQYVKRVKESLDKGKTQSYQHKKNVMSGAERSLARNPKNIHVANWRPWTSETLQHIGFWCLDVMHKCLLFKDEPLFSKSLVFRGKKSYNVLILSPHIADWVDEYKESVSLMSPLYAPLCIPPANWSTPYNGGFYSDQLNITLPLVKGTKKHLKWLSNREMPVVYNAVNRLQRVAYKINRDVLQVLDVVFKRELSLGIQSREPFKTSKAPVPDDYKNLKGRDLLAVLDDQQKSEFLKWKEKSASVYRKEKTRSAKYMEEFRTLQQANKYKLFKAFYFTIGLDFRSRVYYNSSLLNPQGNDLQKSLLRFSASQKIGRDGKFWLAISGSGHLGYDKTCNEDRYKYIKSIEPDIIRYAEDSIRFTGWAGAENPWQFLSFCQEWRSIHEWELFGNKASTYKSDYIAYFDASCSGLQHLSAMIGDTETARHVNLIKSSEPRSIYLFVVDKIVKALNHMLKSKIVNLWGKVGIEKDLTKIPVMTIAYDAKMQTFEKAVIKYLDEYEDKHGKVFNKTIKHEAVKFMSKLLWNTIKGEVKSAKLVMDYLKKVTWVISSKNKPSIWITPTGFIVIHEELSSKLTRLRSQMLGGTYFTVKTNLDKIDKYKMSSSVSADVIHSQDASHLMFIVVEFEGDISVIHDSYGVHLNRVRELKNVYLITFKDMYRDYNVLEEFKINNEYHIQEVIEVPVPENMGFDLDEVLESEYAVN